MPELRGTAVRELQMTARAKQEIVIVWLLVALLLLAAACQVPLR